MDSFGTLIGKKKREFEKVVFLNEGNFQGCMESNASSIFGRISKFCLSFVTTTTSRLLLAGNWNDSDKNNRLPFSFFVFYSLARGGG